MEGVEYPGKHEALVSEELYAEVQRVRQSRAQSGEKPRVRSHYLKGSVHCGRCGEPLTFTQARSRTGALYDYFACLGRISLKNGCEFRAIQASHLERVVAEYWISVQLSPSQLHEIRKIVLDHMEATLPSTEAKLVQIEAQLKSLESDGRKVLDAFYADAIDTPELKREQARIASLRALAESEKGKLGLEERAITRSLEHCLEVLESAQDHYRESAPPQRRQMNQGVFKRLYVDDDEIVASDLKPAFRGLTSTSLKEELDTERKTYQTASVQTKDLYLVPEVDDQSSRGHEDEMKMLATKARRGRPERQKRPSGRLERPRGALSWESKNHGPLEDRGSNELLLVAGAGFEPATSGPAVSEPSRSDIFDRSCRRVS